jgi:succinate dehydrogenase/fumarate reductase flavoprotein subunit
MEILETDVLCIGGGIAGLMAATRASELGADVIVAEKGNTSRSGEGRAGNDHFWCYIPEVHGTDPDAFIRECMLTQLSGLLTGLGPSIVRTWMENSFDIVKLWDSWGIPMKYNGNWEFAGHSFPGRLLTHLKYSGQNQKPILTKEALKRGARIVNRVMVFELLGDADGVTGAMGIDTRKDRLIEFKAKSVILGTGAMTRLFPNLTPGIIGNDSRPFTLSGDGRAAAYRLGAELFDVESINRHIGVSNYCRSGQATWVGVYRYPDGKPIGKYVNKPDRKYGDILPEVDKAIFSKVIETGQGPVYMDCTGITEDDYEYMMYWMKHEANNGLLDHLKEEDIDLRRNPVEFQSYPIRGGGRILANEKAETTVKGLYSGGEESYGTMSSAAVFGWLAGENAAKYSKEPFSVDEEKGRETIEAKTDFVNTLQSRSKGTNWKDANMALQFTMSHYCGLVRSESMLSAGLNHLRRLKNNACGTMTAANQWELTRCLEVLNLYDIGELMFLGALERKESRGLHRRADYRLTDPLYNHKLLVVNKQNGNPNLKWKDMES